MPRGARRDAPNEIHHVWVRGIERRAIFADDHDRFALLERLGLVLQEGGACCLAWALLPNHYHLVVKRRDVSLSRMMSRINTGYATAFNRRHDRAGFLFQNRFGSRVVQGDAELVAVVRYVANNPVKHGSCKPQELADYPWCSASGISRRRVALPFESLLETRRILGMNGARTPSRAPREIGVEPTSHGLADLEVIIARVCQKMAVDPSDLPLRRRTRDLADARAIVCWVATSRLGTSGADIGRRLGMTRSAVSHALARGRRLAEELGLASEVVQQFNQRPR